MRALHGKALLPKVAPVANLAFQCLPAPALARLWIAIGLVSKFPSCQIIRGVWRPNRVKFGTTAEHAGDQTSKN
jgi:hypothetical protein